MTTTAINNYEDIIDSRNIIERIEDLEGYDCADLDDDERNELKALKELASEASGYASDWPYGETLIRDTYFKDYAMELADDIGAINSDASWPNTCIDWDQAARELQMDYTCIDFDGVDYWIRAS